MTAFIKNTHLQSVTILFFGFENITVCTDFVPFHVNLATTLWLPADSPVTHYFTFLTKMLFPFANMRMFLDLLRLGTDSVLVYQRRDKMWFFTLEPRK